MRSPSIRLWSFRLHDRVGGPARDVRVGESSLQVGVGDERDAAGEVRLRWAGDRLDGRVVLDAREERRGRRGDQYSAGQRSADRRAELCAVFSRPPTSPLYSSGTADAVAARPRGERRSDPHRRAAAATWTIRCSATVHERGRRPRAPPNIAMKPRRMTRRGFACGNTFGTPAAKSSNISESGSRCMPVATADKPRATDRNSETTKKIPACTRNRKKNEVTPSRSWMFRSIFGSISAAWPRADSRAPVRKSQRASFLAPSSYHSLVLSGVGRVGIYHDQKGTDSCPTQPGERRGPSVQGRNCLGTGLLFRQQDSAGRPASHERRRGPPA